MRAVSSIGRIPTRRVRVEDVEPDATDDEILECALAFTGETRESLFGWDIHRFDTVAAVALHTD